MILIGENIHIISKQVKEALEFRDENFIKNLIKIQQNCDAIDLNIGPAKGKLDNIFEWLCSLVDNKNISFDSANISAIEQGLKLYGNQQSFINSTSADEPKLDILTNLAMKYNCNLIALTMSKKTGVPKEADARMELAFEIYEKCIEKGIPSEKIFFDPLILPLKVDQSQALETLNTVKMIKESFDPPVKTLVGLSNISNGMPSEYRSLINRVYAVLLIGAGLDAAIVDAKDKELFRIVKMLENNSPKDETDNLYINLANMVKEYQNFADIKYDKNNKSQCIIMKTAEILLGEKIYSDSFAQI